MVPEEEEEVEEGEEEEEVLDAWLDSKVGIHGHFLCQSSASVDCRHVWRIYHDLVVHDMEVEDRVRR